jgi:hypothetical protein
LGSHYENTLLNVLAVRDVQRKHVEQGLAIGNSDRIEKVEQFRYLRYMLNTDGEADSAFHLNFNLSMLASHPLSWSISIALHHPANQCSLNSLASSLPLWE